MKSPLVTIICICYNQANYVTEALRSVWNLKYVNIQLIIADDASTDGSRDIIQKLVYDREVELIFNQNNIGHCKTFNQALQLARGEFVVDFAADDILLPNSINVGINRFSKLDKTYGVFYADAELIGVYGEHINNHITARYFDSNVPEGNIYEHLLSRYFINPPTMILRKTLLDELGGYNQSLSYEDFDFWVRSSRITKYCYLPVITIKKRIHSKSVSFKQYSYNSKMLVSTFEVCKIAFKLNKTKKEDKALIKRITYETKMAISSFNLLIATKLTILFVKVLFKNRS